MDLNPFVKEAAMSILRKVLTGAAGVLVGYGVWSDKEAVSYVTGLSVFLIAAGWGYMQQKWNRSKLVTSLAMPAGSTEKDVETLINSGAPTPSVTLEKTAAPKVIRKPRVAKA